MYVVILCRRKGCNQCQIKLAAATMSYYKYKIINHSDAEFLCTKTWKKAIESEARVISFLLLALHFYQVQVITHLQSKSHK